jgi:hypothetical protein
MKERHKARFEVAGGSEFQSLLWLPRVSAASSSSIEHVINLVVHSGCYRTFVVPSKTLSLAKTCLSDEKEGPEAVSAGQGRAQGEAAG